MLIDEILNRLKEYLKTEIDADVARALGVKPQNIINWPKRGTIPWPELFTFSQAHNVSFDWLLTGKHEANFMCSWPEETIDYCNKLKNVLEKGEEKQITAIKEMIDVYSEKTKRTPKKGLEKKVMSST